MTIVGLLLIIYIIWVLVTSKPLKYKIISLFSITLFFELFANSGTIWEGIKYSDVLWVILFVCTCVYVKNRSIKINPLQNREYVIFLFVLLIELVIEVIWPYKVTGFNLRSFLVFFKYLFSIYVYLVLIKTLKFKDYNLLLRVLYKFQIIVYVVVIIEFTYENIFGMSDYGRLIVALMGPSENMVAWNETRFGMSSIQGLCKEPSHFAILLFFTNVIFLLSYRFFDKGIKCFFINCFLMIVSGSLSSVLYIFALIFFWIAYVPMKHKALYLASLIVLFLGIVYFNADIFEYYLGRLTNIASFANAGIDTYTSEGVRLGSAVESLLMFKSRPLFGVGLGNNVNTCGFFTMLSTIGFVGFVFYMMTIIRINYQWIPTISIVFAALFAMDGGVFYSSYFFAVLFFCYNSAIRQFGKSRAIKQHKKSRLTIINHRKAYRFARS